MKKYCHTYIGTMLQKGHTNIQESFHLDPCWHRQTTNASLGLLLPQTEMTLNKLQATNISPYVSAYAHMHQQHDYNHMPLASLGCHAMAQNKSETRGHRASEGFLWAPQQNTTNASSLDERET